MNRVIQPPRVPMTPDGIKAQAFETLNQKEMEYLAEEGRLGVRELANARAAVVEALGFSVLNKSSADIVKNCSVEVAFNRLADAEKNLKDNEGGNVLPFLQKIKDARTHVYTVIKTVVETMSHEGPSDKAGPAKKPRRSAQGEPGPAKEDSPPAGGSKAFDEGCVVVDLTKDSE